MGQMTGDRQHYLFRCRWDGCQVTLMVRAEDGVSSLLARRSWQDGARSRGVDMSARSMIAVEVATHLWVENPVECPHIEGVCCRRCCPSPAEVKIRARRGETTLSKG